jgi:hypothetical protein
MQPLNTEQMIITDARHMPIVKAYAKKSVWWKPSTDWSTHRWN